ncbi:MAG TPA: Crp/Fnr family transcriptional regulator [Acidiferrobacteraceae bacterium]|nr:Crp/Fnr family transcriptional regulator [Acidiferrobacteraceae bacterium]
MSGNPSHRLAAIFQGLTDAKRTSLLDFAEFLHAQEGGVHRDSGVKEPLSIPRPGEETVVKAIQRLTITYPMIDATELMNESTALVSQHVMEGRAAMEVINDLEILFQSHYERLTENE